MYAREFDDALIVLIELVANHDTHVLEDANGLANFLQLRVLFPHDHLLRLLLPVNEPLVLRLHLTLKLLIPRVLAAAHKLLLLVLFLFCSQLCIRRAVLENLHRWRAGHLFVIKVRVGISSKRCRHQNLRSRAAQAH